MEILGEYLRKEREVRGVEVEDVSSAIKVPLNILKALEADQYDMLPPPAFVKGFIRAYCKFLGVEDNDAVLRYECYLQEIADFEDKPSRSSENMLSRAVNARKRVLSIALLGAGLVIVGAFYLFSGGGERAYEKPAAIVDADKPQAADAAGDTVAAKEDQGASEAPTPKPAPSPSAAAVKKRAPKVAEATGKPPAVTTGDADKSAESAVPVPSAHNLSVYAMEITWLRVKVDGGEPREVLLREGERVTWFADRSFNIFVGNAAGVELTMDGEKLSPLGESGETVRLTLPLSLPPLLPDAKPVGSESL